MGKFKENTILIPGIIEAWRKINQIETDPVNLVKGQTVGDWQLNEINGIKQILEIRFGLFKLWGSTRDHESPRESSRSALGQRLKELILGFSYATTQETTGSLHEKTTKRIS